MKEENSNLIMLLNILGNQRGARRPIDNLGRIVIPKDFRSYLGWNVGDTLEIKMFDSALVIMKGEENGKL